jgi:signal transduction histidine kinase
LIRIDDILWEMKEELTKVFPHYKVNIEFSLNLDHESLQIQGDEQLMKIAIMNLMDNGCKYSDDHRVSVNLKSNTNTLELDFFNNGQGIESEAIKKIFTPFFRGKHANKVKGFGIGLSLVSRIIKLHGGEINVESTPHEKTQFCVVLPTNHSYHGLIPI